MKTSVLVAAICVGVMVFTRLFIGVFALVSGRVSIFSVAWIFHVLWPIALAVLILLGIAMGHRLAWQWGRLFGLFGAVVLTVAAVSAFRQANGRPEFIVVAVLVALQGVPLFPMFFALGTRGAKQHFRLICPQCGHARPKAANFLFTKAICRKCGESW